LNDRVLNTLELAGVADEAIVAFILPERLAGSSQQQITLARRCSLQPAQ
jgi:hypothetical protein